MSDVVFNIALGRVVHYASLPETSDALVIVLLKDTVQADATLRDHDTLASVLGANDQSDFTNYARKTVSSATITVDDTNNWVDVDIADQTWTSAGGASNNDVKKLLICYDGDTGGGTDANIVPLTAHDFVVTTDGSDLTAQIAASGFFRAS